MYGVFMSPRKMLELKVLKWKPFFDDVAPLKGIQSAHSIHRVNNMCVTMFANTGDGCPMAKDINFSKKQQSISVLPATFELEKYYAVYYDDKWYIGRAVSNDATTQCCKMKFLQETHQGFKWPNLDDIHMVEINFFLCGPVNLIGNLPFNISAEDRSKITKLYKNCKKKTNN